MTKFYGAVVGTPKSQARPVPVPFGMERGSDHVLVRDRIELAAVATDTVQAAILPWETVIDPYGSDVSFDDLGTGTTVSLGDITYPNALCNATDAATAAASVKALKSVDIANYFKPLWETLGYATLAAAKLIGPQCELLFKINTAAAAGTMVWCLKGQAK